MNASCVRQDSTSLCYNTYECLILFYWVMLLGEWLNNEVAMSIIADAPRDFHVSRVARDRYQFDETLFSLQGTVIFANFHAARVFAQKMNQKRDLVNFPEQAVKASQINAMGLIHELTHYMFRDYCQKKAPTLLRDMLTSATQRAGVEAVDATLRKFVDEFPPLPVYRREMDVQTYVEGTTEGTPNRELIVEEMLMLCVSNANPAFATFHELFDDTTLKKETSYGQVITGAQILTSGKADGTTPGVRGGVGADYDNVLDLLLAPARAHPHSLEGQLEFIRQRWGTTLGRYVYRLLSSLDLIKEENRAVFFGGGPGIIPIPVYGPGDVETENFTPDREWMPQLVMLAKNAYVWLVPFAGVAVEHARHQFRAGRVERDLVFPVPRLRRLQPGFDVQHRPGRRESRVRGGRRHHRPAGRSERRPLLGDGCRGPAVGPPPPARDAQRLHDGHVECPAGDPDVLGERSEPLHHVGGTLRVARVPAEEQHHRVRPSAPPDAVSHQALGQLVGHRGPLTGILRQTETQAAPEPAVLAVQRHEDRAVARPVAHQVRKRVGQFRGAAQGDLVHRPEW